LVALTDPKSLAAEKFRVLATRLGNLGAQHKLKSLQVTSSVINEGKTLVAANLAVTLASCFELRTLLVEGDLHNSTVESLFGLKGLPGLSTWWSTQGDGIARFLHRVDDMPFWFLTAGKSCEQPSNILQSVRFAEAFASLSVWFDWIVVDSTPMLPIVDANLWSRLVDGTLLVVREGVAPVAALKRGLQSLDDPKLVGIVLNEASEFDRAHYEQKYYADPKHEAKRRYR
jgi:capsular exopolysaccharide synthesis family protein